MPHLRHAARPLQAKQANRNDSDCWRLDIKHVELNAEKGDSGDWVHEEEGGPCVRPGVPREAVCDE